MQILFLGKSCISQIFGETKYYNSFQKIAVVKELAQKLCSEE